MAAAGVDTPHTIVVVEDEPDIREAIEYGLRREGYRVVTAADGVDGLAKARSERPSLVLLDVMLPGLDGVEVCRALKSDDATRSVPVIMVTARDEETDVVLGLGIGADDYVTKPFRSRELVARVKAVLRRSHDRGSHDMAQEAAPLPLVQGPLRVDPGRFVAEVDGERMQLTATEFRLLHFLASHPGRVFEREHLVRRALGDTADVLERNIDVHVRSLRSKLGERRNLIETVRGIGYRFCEQP